MNRRTSAHGGSFDLGSGTWGSSEDEEEHPGTGSDIEIGAADDDADVDDDAEVGCCAACPTFLEDGKSSDSCSPLEMEFKVERTPCMPPLTMSGTGVMGLFLRENMMYVFGDIEVSLVVN